MFVLKDRILLPSGISLLTPEQAAKKIVAQGNLEPHFRVEQCFAAKEYELITGNRVLENTMEDIPPSPDLQHTNQDYDRLVDVIVNSERYSPSMDDRIALEMEFFDRTMNVKFLLKLHDLVTQFKKEGVVWGVGRGSAIASLVLYLLELHDINPCEYGVPFHELSKERL